MKRNKAKMGLKHQGGRSCQKKCHSPLGRLNIRKVPKQIYRTQEKIVKKFFYSLLK